MLKEAEKSGKIRKSARRRTIIAADWTVAGPYMLISRDVLTISVSEGMTIMDFCSSCGSCMKRTPEGLLCPKCGKLVRSEPFIKENNAKKPSQDAIYVIDGAEDNYVRVIRLCPNCGNDEAFYWSSAAIGEHAGVRQERTIEHFKCSKCMHTWVESS